MNRALLHDCLWRYVRESCMLRHSFGRSNAGAHLLPKAGATEVQTLEAVRGGGLLDDTGRPVLHSYNFVPQMICAEI
jgi:hypothetical protein